MEKNRFFLDIKNLFKAKEINSLIIAVLLLALISGFDDGSKEFVFSHWILNFITMLLISVLVLAVAEITRKIYAYKQGYLVDFKILVYPLLIGLAVSLFSKGKIWYILIPGTIFVTHIEGMRIGKFRYGMNVKDLGKIAFSGIYAVLLLAVILKFLLILFPNHTYLQKAMIFSISYVIFNSLPIPPILGHHMFFASRLTYVFTIIFVTAVALLLLAVNPIIAVISGGILSIIFGVAYYFFFELKTK